MNANSGGLMVRDVMQCLLAAAWLGQASCGAGVISWRDAPSAPCVACGDADPESEPSGGGGDTTGDDGAGDSLPDGDPGLTEPPTEMGQPGCGLESAAFCDGFDAPAAARGRGSELDVARWSTSRSHGQPSNTEAVAVGMAQIPSCRADVPTEVWPDRDTFVCPPTSDIHSGHLLVGVASQFYGQNGYRIRQPFDFAGRTGTIVFDATAWPLSPLHGWVSLAITEEPIAVPGYAILGNDEGSVIPKNAVEVHFANYGGGDGLGLRNVQVFRDWVDTFYVPPTPVSTSYRRGKLNRYEIRISESRIEVRVSPYSEDGVSFAPAELVYAADAEVPFSRGYVHLEVHNHATLKYTHPSDGFAAIVNATVAQIDNVGFDGPVVLGWREHEVPDALREFQRPGFQPDFDPNNAQGRGLELGYFVGDVSEATLHTLHVQDVDPDGVVRARVAFTTWLGHYATATYEQFEVQVRVNGHAWHERRLSAAEAALYTPGPTTLDPNGADFSDSGSQGRLALVVEVPVEELVPGDNAIELCTANVAAPYRPVVNNVDLLLDVR